MAIKINIPLTSPTGLDIPAESVIVFDTTFNAGVLRMINTYHLYKSIPDYQSGMREISGGVNGLNMAHIQNFTKMEFASLTFPKVEQYVQQAIETQIGEGTTTIVDLLPND